MSYPAGGGYPPTQLIDYDDLEEFSGEQTMKGAMFLNSMPVAPDQSNFTSTIVVEPTALGRAILDGTSPPICGPEYAGPYPRTNSVPFKGMFMRGTPNEGRRRSASGVDETRGVLSSLSELRDYINAELSGASPAQRQALMRTLRRAVQLGQEVRAAEGTSEQRTMLLRAKEEAEHLWESTRDLVQAILAGYDDVPSSDAVVTPDLPPTMPTPDPLPPGETQPTHAGEAAQVASYFQSTWGMLEAYMIQQEDQGLDPWKTDIMVAGQEIGQSLQMPGEPPTMTEADYAQQLEASLREIGYDDSQIALYFTWIAGMRENSEEILGEDLPLADAVGTMGGAVMMGSFEDVNTYFASMSPEMLAYWEAWSENLEAYLSGTVVVLEEEGGTSSEGKGGVPTGLLVGGAAALAALAFMR